MHALGRGIIGGVIGSASAAILIRCGIHSLPIMVAIGCGLTIAIVWFLDFRSA